MNYKLSSVEIRQQAGLVNSVAKRMLGVAEQLLVDIRGLQEIVECLPLTIKESHDFSNLILPQIGGLHTVMERVPKDAKNLCDVGERLSRFDEDLQPELGFTPYWTHVEDAKVFAGDLEEDLNRILSFSGNLATDIPQLYRPIRCLQKTAKSFETIKDDLRGIHLFGAS